MDNCDGFEGSLPDNLRLEELSQGLVAFTISDMKSLRRGDLVSTIRYENSKFMQERVFDVLPDICYMKNQE